MTRKIFSLVLSVLAGNSFAAAPTAAQINSARIAGLSWLFTHQSQDGSWKDASGGMSQATSASILAMMNAGIVKGYSYTWALSSLQNTPSSSVDSLSRQIITLNKGGLNVTPLINQLSQWKNGNNAWGAYRGYGSSLPDTPLALSALVQTQSLTTTNLAQTLCYGLLAAQRPDNSFSYLVNGISGSSTQSSGYVVPTAYAAAALDSVRKYTGWPSLSCNPSSFSAIVTSAANWMLGKQSSSDGGFGDNGQSAVLETAVAYQALKQINQTTYATALDNALGYLIAQQGADGSWSGDPLATAMALQALPQLAANSLTDSNSNGMPDVVEVYLGRDPNAIDHIASGNGLGASGTNTAQLLATGIQSQAMTVNLSAGGMTTPTTWQITSGYLPAGLSMNAGTGQVSGNPALAGTFNFTYTVTGSDGSQYTQASQLTVEVAGDANGDEKADLADYLILEKIILNNGANSLSNQQRARVDMYPVGGSDGILDLSDLLLLKKKILSNG